MSYVLIISNFAGFDIFAYNISTVIYGSLARSLRIENDLNELGVNLITQFVNWNKMVNDLDTDIINV